MNKKELDSIKAIIRNHNSEIDYKKLAQAIVEAEAEAEKQRELSKQEAHKVESMNLLKKYGYIEGNSLSRIWANMRIVLFPKKEDIKGEYTTISLLQIAAETLLLIGEGFLYLFCITGAVILLKPSLIDNADVVMTRITVVCICFVAFVIARVLNTSRHEIENMKDKEYINVIVGSIMTVVATIVALIELFRGA